MKTKISLLILSLGLSAFTLMRSNEPESAETTTIQNPEELISVSVRMMRNHADLAAEQNLGSALSSSNADVRRQAFRDVELLARKLARNGIDPKSNKARSTLRLLSKYKTLSPAKFEELKNENKDTPFEKYLEEV